jgi:hypothetical protein
VYHSRVVTSTDETVCDRGDLGHAVRAAAASDDQPGSSSASPSPPRAHTRAQCSERVVAERRCRRGQRPAPPPRAGGDRQRSSGAAPTSSASASRSRAPGRAGARVTSSTTTWRRDVGSTGPVSVKVSICQTRMCAFFVAFAPPAIRPVAPRSGAALGAGPSDRRRSGAVPARPRAR